MANFKAPTNDNARLTFLNRAVETAKQDKEKENVFVNAETIERIVAFIPQFTEGLYNLNSKLSTRSKEVRENEEALISLQTYIRDGWELMRRRVYRKGLPAEVFSFYELPLSGKSPNPTSREEWLTIADKMVKGDARAVEAGYETIREPNAAEITKALEKAIAESKDVALADRDYDQEQDKVKKLRIVADELIHELMSEMRYFLRKEDDPSQRRIMKTYGAEFNYAKGEPGEPNEPNVPNEPGEPGEPEEED